MTSTLNQELYSGMLYIAKSKNKIGRLQLATVACFKIKSVKLVAVMLASFRLLLFLYYRFICLITQYKNIALNSASKNQ
jgi:hypothetical protein